MRFAAASFALCRESATAALADKPWFTAFSTISRACFSASNWPIPSSRSSLISLSMSATEASAAESFSFEILSISSVRPSLKPPKPFSANLASPACLLRRLLSSGLNLASRWAWKASCAFVRWAIKSSAPVNSRNLSAAVAASAPASRPICCCANLRIPSSGCAISVGA